MTDRPMNATTVENALRELGERLDHHCDVDILLVGGAAGMLTGLLAPNRVTTDCDVMVYLPPDALVAVESAAADVADAMSLPQNWLNSDVQMRADTLPDGWEQRRVPVGAFGRLHVFAASRPDLIAMKVIAGRDQDIDDLIAMRIRVDEIGFVNEYLNGLSAKGTSTDQIHDARKLLDSLESHDHE